MKQLINSLTWTNLITKLKVILNGLSEATSVSSDDITDATTTGKSLITASDAEAVRTAIGAGTSNLAIGTTSTTAKAGNYQPTVANISDATAIGRSILTAADASAARSAIGAGTSSLAIGTTGTTAAAGNHTHTATQVTATAVGSGSATNVQGILVELHNRIVALESA